MSRKKRKQVSGAREDKEQAIDILQGGDDDTDVKLATLASLYDSVDQAVLLDALVNANGSTEDASKALQAYTEEPRRKLSSPPRKVIGYQSSLSAFRIAGKNGNPVKRLTKKGQTLHLYTPEDVAAHTPCSIIHNFLPPEEANDLLRELLAEAPTFERQTFKVFDNVVQSPHSACFYVHSLEEKRQQQTEYLYNGSYLTVRAFATSLLTELTPIGCPRDIASHACCFWKGTEGCQSRDLHQNQDLPRRREAKVSVARRMEAKRSICQQLRWWC